jgi:hypothetical protein
MKTGVFSSIRVHFIALAALTVSAYAQPTLNFCNHCLPSPPDRRVLDVYGASLLGTNYVAQLYYGSSPDSLVADARPPARFRAAGTSFPGTWTPDTRILVSPVPGQTLYMQVRVWDRSAFNRYEDAAGNMTGSQYGQSEVFTYTPCSTPPAPNCELMLGFRGFRLTANPPPYLLVIRENGPQLDLLFAGAHTLEAAASIDGPWTNLGVHAAPYTDPDSATLTQRFYRINDAGVCSSNAVGYYRLSLCNGFSLIANQLDAPGGNSVTNVFRSPPAGTVIYKYDPAGGGYVSISFLGGAWEGDDLEMTLHPGEGVWVNGRQFTQTFLGGVRSVASVPLRSGFSIISYSLPRSGTLESLGGLGFPAGNGDEIYQFDCSSGGYRANWFLDCCWEGDEAHSPPSAALGEAFWINRTGAPAQSWNVTYSVCP